MAQLKNKEAHPTMGGMTFAEWMATGEPENPGIPPPLEPEPEAGAEASAEAAVVATQAGAVAEGGGGERDARLAGTDSQPADELEPRATAGLVKDIGMIYNR